MRPGSALTPDTRRQARREPPRVVDDTWTRRTRSGTIRFVLLRLTPTETVEPLVVEADRLLVRVSWEGGHGRPPVHVHPAHDEIFEVLSGRLGVRLGSWTGVHEPGEQVHAWRGTPHAMWPVDGPAEATWECRPAGRVLEWFQALDGLTARGYRGPALLLARAALAGRYDDVFRLSARPQPVVRAGLRALAALARR